MKELRVARLSTASIYKLAGIGLFFSLFPFTIVMGITAFFGLNTLMWNNQPLTGSTALIAAPFIGLFLSGVFTVGFYPVSPHQRPRWLPTFRPSPGGSCGEADSPFKPAHPPRGLA